MTALICTRCGDLGHHAAEHQFPVRQCANEGCANVIKPWRLRDWYCAACAWWRRRGKRV